MDKMKNIIWFISRWWKEFTCTHRNAQFLWSDGQGTNIVVCRVCHRANIHVDNEKNQDVE